MEQDELQQSDSRETDTDVVDEAEAKTSRKGSDAYSVSSTLSYGKDLWDSLGVLTDNTV